MGGMMNGTRKSRAATALVILAGSLLVATPSPVAAANKPFHQLTAPFQPGAVYNSDWICGPSPWFDEAQTTEPAERFKAETQLDAIDPQAGVLSMGASSEINPYVEDAAPVPAAGATSVSCQYDQLLNDWVLPYGPTRAETVRITMRYEVGKIVHTYSDPKDSTDFELFWCVNVTGSHQGACSYPSPIEGGVYAEKLKQLPEPGIYEHTLDVDVDSRNGAERGEFNIFMRASISTYVEELPGNVSRRLARLQVPLKIISITSHEAS